MIAFGLLKQEIIVVDCSPISATITSFHDAMPAHISFQSLCLEDVLSCLEDVNFLLDWGVLVKEPSQSIKVLMTEQFCTGI